MLETIVMGAYVIYDLLLLANPKEVPLMHFLLCGKALVSGRIKVADYK